jgi:glycosyltransferase involved in cell wall biosynthesis
MNVRPLVSVIITCYNHGKYLSDAIRSVLKQTYRNLELLVVDDGSTDNTPEVVLGFPDASYVYQSNSGLSAARNKGIVKSRGSYLVFLDADDWLYPDAIQTNLEYLQQNPACGFVSGWHDKVNEWGHPLHDQDEQVFVEDNHYQRFLWGNYIGMHATVMYQRWAFSELKFDTSLKACEDYDMYFKISRKFDVGCHTKKLAAYRIHGKNMSANIALMLTHVLLVCNRQRHVLKNSAEIDAYINGLRIWSDYYSDKLCSELEKEGDTWPGANEISLLVKEKPLKCLRLIAKKTNRRTMKWLKNNLPDFAQRMLHKAGAQSEFVPRVGNIDRGDFDRVRPFSTDFGFDRGGAIDRYYIENFIRENANVVCGNVLEIGDNEYTLKFGQNSVKQSDILHVDQSNSKATYVGDITHVPEIPTGYFDCIIFTQTLHLIYDYRSALQTCYRILKPGGSLLLTVPGISQIDKGMWKDYWLWSFSATAMRKLMAETFNGSTVDIKSYGNVYVATSFLYGMGLPEIRKEKLDHHDPSYQLIISVKAVKQGESIC